MIKREGKKESVRERETEKEKAGENSKTKGEKHRKRLF